MKTSLIPCPFCNKETKQPDCFRTDEHNYGRVFCTNCGATGPIVDLDNYGVYNSVYQPWHDKASTKWNKRKR